VDDSIIMKKKRKTLSKPESKGRAKPGLTAATRLVLWHRLQEGGFILLSTLAIFLCVALITYHEADPGWSHTTPQQGIQNAAGEAGAWFADLCLYLFGYVAYLIPLLIGYGSIRLFQNRFESSDSHRFLWGLRIIGFGLTVVSGCGLASLHFDIWSKGMPVSAGGICGQIISAELNPFLGYLGSTLVLLAVFLTGITLTTGLSWFGLIDRMGKGLLLGFGNFCAILPRALTYLKDWKQRYKDRKTVIKTLKAERVDPTLGTRKLKREVVIDAVPLKPKFLEMKEVKPAIPSTRILPVDPQLPLNTELPSVTLLEEAEPKNQTECYSPSKLEALSREVETRLLEFGVQVSVVAVEPGPVITRFELELAAGLKVSKITGLAKDLARALTVTRVRVVEVIPGKSVVGLEIPNEYRELVRLREILESSQYIESASHLSLALGKDIAGIPVVVNLAKMPHLLVAGTTGSGKSVGINVMLLSLLYKAMPRDVRLILIDPKMLELSIYDGIPHLLTPVVTDMKDAANALRWCVAEMERRYKLMAALGVRNLVGYNRKVCDAERANQPILDPFWLPASKGGGANVGDERPALSSLPHIVVIIDEFADMIMVVGKKVEELIARIAQKARAAGIHLILATQRPSVDVITGLIKANVPTRIAFQVSSRIDSRTILDQQGAEQLLGHGDMLYLPPGTGVPIRIHGAFVSDEEVHAVVKSLKQLGEPDYAIDVLGGSGDRSFSSGLGGFEEEESGEQDDLYDSAVQIVAETRRASISHLQRRLKIGYNRAARLIETMEAAGIVSNMQSNGGREVLVQEPEMD
jgi:S-DNA-T family DNA segregation ATPase FtsK/SpoIIIE